MSSFWDELKEAFKTKSQREEERQQRLQEAVKAEGELTKKLDELDKSYLESQQPDEEIDLDKLFPKDSGHKEIEYKPLEDKEILEIAKAENTAKKKEKLDKLESDYEKEKTSFEQAKLSADENLKDSYENLKNLYSELKEKLENDSIKRGMARSSVISGQIGDLQGQHIKAAGEVEGSYNKTISDINAEISSLEKQQDSALELLDLKSASELNNRITELKSQRDKNILENEKYNSSVREKNIKYSQDRQNKIDEFLKKQQQDKIKQQNELSEYEQKYGYSGEKLQNYTKRYDLAYEFYTSLSPDIAVNALEASPNMKYYLGVNYDKLKNALKAKESTNKKYY